MCLDPIKGHSVLKPNHVKFTIFIIQQKLVRYAKKQENMANNNEDN